MRKLIILIFAALLIIGCTSNTHVMKPEIEEKPKEDNSKIKWRTYTAKRIKLASMKKKPVFLLFTRYDCHNCTILRREALSDEYVIKVINDSFEPLIVRSTNDKFFKIADELGITSVPTIFIIRPSGRAIRIRGIIPKDKLLEILVLVRMGL